MSGERPAVEVEGAKEPNLPKHPSPVEALDDGGADQRNEIFAAQKQQRVDSDAESLLMEEKDFANGGAWKTFDRADCHALEEAGDDQPGKGRGQSTPDGAEDDGHGSTEIDRPLSVENGRWGSKYGADSQAKHEDAHSERNIGNADVVLWQRR